MNLIIRHLGVLFSALALASCALEPIDERIEPSGDFDKVTIQAHDFVWGESPATKTSLTISQTDGAVFAWSAGDIVGIYPDVGTQVRFPILEGIGEGTQVANFTGGGWAVKGAHTYMAYYPFIPNMDLDKEAIPVDYTGQIQNGNNSTAHLSPFDFMAAAASSPSDGEISFDFKHLASLLMLNLTVPKVGEYTTLTLSCSSVPFVTKGTVDITADTPAITPTDWSNEFVIHLSNFSTTQANEDVVIFALIPPVDMSEQTITVNIRGEHADCETSFTRNKNKPFVAGRSYRPSMGAMVGGDVIKLESGHQFNEDIKSLVNGEHFIFDKTDYRIQSVSFEVGDDEVPTEYARVDVSAPDSPSPIYAYWKPDARELVIRTPSNKLFANEDPSGMFYKLNQLSSIDLDGFDLSFASTIEQLFAGCSSLTVLDLSGFNTSDITSFSGLFSGCESLSTLDISSFNVEKAITLSGMFEGCKSITGLDLSHFKTSNELVWLTDMFNGCTALSSLVFSDDFHTGSVSFYDKMFHGCEHLETLDLSMFDTSNGSSFQRMFMNCTALSDLDINLKITSNANVLEGLFGGCESLTSIDVTSWDLTNVGGLDGVFSGCSSLTTIGVGDWNVSNVRSFDWLFADCSALTTLDLSSWNTSAAESFYNTFGNCSSIANLNTSGFVTNSVTNFQQMFYGCSLLETIDLSSFNTAKGVKFSGMFANCSALTAINLSTFNTSSANDLSCMFDNCSSLASIDLSSFNVSKVIDMSSMFYRCTDLKDITFGDFDTHYCENFEGMFMSSGFEELDLSAFNTSSATNMTNMFNHCTSLTRLNVSSFDTSHCGDTVDFIGDCPVLGEIRFGHGFTNGLCSNFASGLARDIESCTIYCTAEFKNAWLSSVGTGNYQWLNCDTGEPLE